MNLLKSYVCRRHTCECIYISLFLRSFLFNLQLPLCLRYTFLIGKRKSVCSNQVSDISHRSRLYTDQPLKQFSSSSSHKTKERSVKSAPWALVVSECLMWRKQGGKNRRRGKNENDDDKCELVFREDDQEYAQVTKMLGNGRLEAQCFDGEKRLAHIRGKMRKKVCSFTCSHFHSEEMSSLNWRSGLDQPGRYCTIVSARIPGRKGRCDCEIYGRRGSESYVSLLDLQHQIPKAPPNSKSIWRTAWKCENQRDRRIWRGGWWVCLWVWRWGRDGHWWYLIRLQCPGWSTLLPYY